MKAPALFRAIVATALLVTLPCPTTVRADTPDSERHSHDSLHCGDATLHAETVRLVFDDAVPSQVLRQTLSLETAAGERIALPVDGRLQRKRVAGTRPVLDAALSSWACLKQGATPPYLLLAYTCTDGEERGECRGPAKEWNRLFTVQGRHLTAGLKRHDRREDAMYAREGLQQTLRDGVAMTGLGY